jgi:hypothetical protein
MLSGLRYEMQALETNVRKPLVILKFINFAAYFFAI